MCIVSSFSQLLNANVFFFFFFSFASARVERTEEAEGQSVEGPAFTFNHNLDILGVSQVVVGYIWLVERTGRAEGDVSSGLGPQEHRIHRPTIAEGYGLKHLLPHLQEKRERQRARVRISRDEISAAGLLVGSSGEESGLLWCVCARVGAASTGRVYVLASPTSACVVSATGTLPDSPTRGRKCSRSEATTLIQTRRENEKKEVS